MLMIHFSVKSNNLKSLSYLGECFTAVICWMSLNFCHLNTGKTEVLVFGSYSFSKISHYIVQLSSNIKSPVKNRILPIFEFVISYSQIHSSFFINDI